ncbi:MAG TPA: hypothetical protein VMW53_09895 [archaeon]|nr:hypothetical protein [archaeon]
MTKPNLQPEKEFKKYFPDSPNPRQYWGKVKEQAFESLELSPIWVRLKLPAEYLKMRFTDCVNTESVFRLIQSIPSMKASFASSGKKEMDGYYLTLSRFKSFFY